MKSKDDLIEYYKTFFMYKHQIKPRYILHRTALGVDGKGTGQTPLKAVEMNINNKQITSAFKLFKNDPDATKDKVMSYFRELKFFTNNDFAFIDVHNEELFKQNSEILLKMVKMFQDIKLKTEEQNQLRAKAIQEATIFSIEVPYKTASLSLEALRLLDFLIKNGNQNAITDIGVGTLMLSAGMEGAILNVKVNLGQIKDKQIYDKYRDGCKEILSEGNEIKDNIISNIHKQLD